MFFRSRCHVYKAERKGRRRHPPDERYSKLLFVHRMLELFSLFTQKLFLQHLAMSPARDTAPGRVAYCISIEHSWRCITI